MSSKSLGFLGLVLAALTAVVPPQSRAAPTVNDGRDADRAAIRAHIEGITQAFIERSVRLS